MPTRKNAGQPSEPLRPPTLTVPRFQVEKALTDQVKQGEWLKINTTFDEETLNKAELAFSRWKDRNSDLLAKYFSNNSVSTKYINTTSFAIWRSLDPIPLEKVAELFNGKLDRNINELTSIIERLDIYEEPTLIPASAVLTINTNKIFVVHGHDEGAKHSLARFLEKLDLEPIILQELPSQGLTVIEKFEKESENVGFAIVLLTPDDVGSTVTNQEDLNKRARQNVIFELGYFAGKLGRGKVCCLKKGNVEIPSDYSGVINISMRDEDNWKLKLGQEMKTAGIIFDANKLY